MKGEFNMKKLIVATIMIGVLTLVITACGEENKKPVTLESDNWENNVTSWDDIEETW